MVMSARKLSVIVAKAGACLIAGLLLFAPAWSADEGTDLEVEKYINVLTEMQSDLSVDLIAQKKKASADETSEEKLDRLNKMVDLMEDIAAIGEYIKEVRAKGFPEAR